MPVVRLFNNPRLARLAATAGFLVAGGGALAQESCAIQSAHLCDGCTVTRRVTVEKDKGCVFRNAISTQIYGISVTVRPRNGSYGKSNATMHAYVPRRGYVGPDFFEYVLHYELYGKRASTTIRNVIEVRAGSPAF